MEHTVYKFRKGKIIDGDEFRSIIGSIMGSCHSEMEDGDENTQIPNENIQVIIKNFRDRKK